jgi:hypothetical protein
LKHITDIFKEITDLLAEFSRHGNHGNIRFALIGGYSVIIHGYERTTRDVDFLVDADIRGDFGKALSSFLKNRFSNTPGVTVEYVPESTDPEDIFRHDLVIIRNTDEQAVTPKIDLVLAKYNWELEGMSRAEPIEGVSVTLMPKPYLVAMKLKAGSPKDDLDIMELFSLMEDHEKQKTFELAKTVHRDRKLADLLTPKIHESYPEDDEGGLLKK